LCYSSGNVLETAIRAKDKGVPRTKESVTRMLAIAKVLLLAFAVSGVAVTGAAAGVVHIPLTKAIDIHKNHLGPDSKLPLNAMKGQQNAYDHLVENQQRWMQNHTVTLPTTANVTAAQ